MPEIWHWHWIPPILLFEWSWYSRVETSSNTVRHSPCLLDPAHATEARPSVSRGIKLFFPTRKKSLLTADTFPLSSPAHQPLCPSLLVATHRAPSPRLLPLRQGVWRHARRRLYPLPGDEDDGEAARACVRSSPPMAGRAPLRSSMADRALPSATPSSPSSAGCRDPPCPVELSHWRPLLPHGRGSIAITRVELPHRG